MKLSISASCLPWFTTNLLSLSPIQERATWPSTQSGGQPIFIRDLGIKWCTQNKTCNCCLNQPVNLLSKFKQAWITIYKKPLIEIKETGTKGTHMGHTHIVHSRFCNTYINGFWSTCVMLGLKWEIVFLYSRIWYNFVYMISLKFFSKEWWL